MTKALPFINTWFLLLTMIMKICRRIPFLILPTAEGALLDHLAVCEGYARAFSRLCEQAGLEELMISGTADNGSGTISHAWNQVQIDAINEALRLFDAGKLTTQSAPSQPVERTDNEIYKSGMRPLIRRKNKNGKTFVYEIKISWIPGSEKPVEIEIKNYFAPVVKRENGLLNVMAKEKEEEIKNVFPLTINEWLWLDHILNAQMRTFEDMNAARLYKIAKDEEWANKSAATAQPSSH